MMSPFHEGLVRECRKTRAAHEGIPSKAEGPRGNCLISQRSYVLFPHKLQRIIDIVRHRRFQPTLVRQYDEAIEYLDSEIADCMRCKDAE
jgi:hypothetical protein